DGFFAVRRAGTVARRGLLGPSDADEVADGAAGDQVDAELFAAVLANRGAPGNRECQVERVRAREVGDTIGADDVRGLDADARALHPARTAVEPRRIVGGAGVGVDAPAFVERSDCDATLDTKGVDAIVGVGAVALVEHVIWIAATPGAVGGRGD